MTEKDTDPAQPLKHGRHEAFVALLLAGVQPWRAWQDSAPDDRKPGRRTATTEASRVTSYPHVRARLDFLRGQVASAGIITRQEMLELASQGARDSTQLLRDRLAAMALVARCQGYDLPAQDVTRPDSLKSGEFGALVLAAKADAAAHAESEVIEQQ